MDDSSTVVVFGFLDLPLDLPLDLKPFVVPLRRLSTLWLLHVSGRPGSGSRCIFVTLESRLSSNSDGDSEPLGRALFELSLRPSQAKTEVILTEDWTWGVQMLKASPSICLSI